jgi:hypothetical protein
MVALDVDKWTATCSMLSICRLKQHMQTRLSLASVGSPYNGFHFGLSSSSQARPRIRHAGVVPDAPQGTTRHETDDESPPAWTRYRPHMHLAGWLLPPTNNDCLRSASKTICEPRRNPAARTVAARSRISCQNAVTCPNAIFKKHIRRLMLILA